MESEQSKLEIADPGLRAPETRESSIVPGKELSAVDIGIPSTTVGAEKSYRLATLGLILHTLLMAGLTATVIGVMTRSQELTLDKFNILVNRNKEALGVQKVILSTPADVFARTNLGLDVKIHSVVATLPDLRAGSEGQQRHDVFTVEASEIAPDIKTTVLHLAGGHLMSISPDLITITHRATGTTLFSKILTEASEVGDKEETYHESSIALPHASLDLSDRMPLVNVSPYTARLVVVGASDSL